MVSHLLCFESSSPPARITLWVCCSKCFMFTVAAVVKCFQTLYFNHILENVLFYSLLCLNLIPVNLNMYLPQKAEAPAKLCLRCSILASYG